MKKHRLDARMIAIMGLLIALMVTLSRWYRSKPHLLKSVSHLFHK